MESDAYFAGGPYTLDGAYDAAMSEWVVQIRVKTQPPLRWSTIVGDAVHNLRSSLDYFVYDLARRDTGKARPRGTQFPIIATDAADYRRAASAGVQMLEPRHRRIIRQLQPYQHDDPGTHPLAILNQLSNADKHRLLHPTIGFLGGAGYRFELRQDVCAIRETRFSFGALEDGAEIVRIQIDTDGPNPRIEVGGEFEFDLAFRETDQSVIGTLFEIRLEIGSILDWFTPVFDPGVQHP